ncbi:mycothiol synthase [Thermosporothrix hazakensis]|uniref:Mycothiol synthase n=2 Tax=Thermosporothrix TaxID=768650 RepID=A0A326U8D5_THEHA|nr:GNAT family N-acetyltransferase [Thermosporothrix hazakensis]PZW29559.1 mycothiol synthase [Thermosporothrix hazakensis]BBH85846.1 hypothetical protein KTC_05970 [Thermosporothrix sp. COM3]GCE45727.1 hypothetical protein KTH_05960 [Thermosporothrix hazakensis]
MTGYFRMRAPTWRDLHAIGELLAICEQAETGQNSRTAQEHSRALSDAFQKTPLFSLARDAWLLVATEQRCIGFASLWRSPDAPLNMVISSRIHPEYCGSGLGTLLLRTAEQRAREVAAGAPATLLSWVTGSNTAARTLLESEGYTATRTFAKMDYPLDRETPPPQIPAGFTLRTFIPEQDEYATYEADNEAFQDSWGYVPSSFTTWKLHNIQRPDFDPSLWFLAIQNETIAGYALCFQHKDHKKQPLGWIEALAVRRPYRRQGLARALLQTAFHEFQRRGAVCCQLNVDLENPTGALHLYEKAGMSRMPNVEIRYEKLLNDAHQSAP